MADVIKPSKSKPVAGPSATTKPSTIPASVSKPSYIAMIEEALNHLSERNGSSAYAIKKYMTSNYDIDTGKNRLFINKAIKKALSEGTLLQTKGNGANGSFKLPPKKKSRQVKEKKNPAAEPTIKVKAVPKKTATVKPKEKKENPKHTKVIPSTSEAPVQKKKPVKRISIVPTPKATLAKPPQNRSAKPAGRRILGAANKTAKETIKPPAPKHIGKIVKADTKMNVKVAVQSNVAAKKNIALATKNQQLANESIETDAESDVNEQASSTAELVSDDGNEDQSEEEYTE